MPVEPPALNTLLPEILGFHPQLLLDDIINAANEPIYQCSEFVSAFMEAWATERAQRPETSSEKDQEEVSMEIQQGIVAFQTLLESHVDLAFDYFEVWTLRNIFFIPPDLPIVVPHQRGLNLHQDPGAESNLFNEIEELRKKLQNQRRLNRLLKSALPISRAQLARAKARFESITFLPSRPPSPTVTSKLVALCDALPDPVLPQLSSLLPPSSQLAADPATRRPWEQGKLGYDHWAVNRLLEKAKKEEEPAAADRDPEIDAAEREIFGDSEDIWALHGAVEAEKTIPGRELDTESYEIQNHEHKKRKIG